MADPLSTGAGVIAFIQLANSVIRACKECIESIKDAPKDMQMILGEVSSLKAIIESFSAADSHANTTKLVPSLFAAGGPVEACQRCLSALRGLLPPDIPESSKGKLRRITVSELAWPFGSQPKARKLLAEISLHKSTLLLAITGDMIHDIKDIRAGVQRLELTITDNQRQEITRWLESVNPSLLHNAAFKKHEEYTSAWLLKSPKWNYWRDQESTQNFLWIHGIPGSGKTVLASFIIEHLKAICSSDPELGCAYYYCHYSHNQDEGTSFLKWTIAQLCRHAKWIPAQLKELYDHGCEPSIPELENALEAVLERFKLTYIVIDGVDESTPRSDMLAVIATIAVDIRFRKIKVLVTSREYFDIERKFSGISEAVSMSNLLVEEDIKLFVHSRLLAGPLKRRFPHLLDRIECVLVAKAQGMFRWAECQIYAIERLRLESEILEALEKLPKDLAETYIRIFENIPEADSGFVHRVLIWICGDAGGLWMQDGGIDANLLVSAVSTDLTEAPSAYNCDDLRELCGCLITFSSGPRRISRENGESSEIPGAIVQEQVEQFAGQSNLVSLAHYTVMEFLVSPLILKSHVSQFALDEVIIFNEFALSCIKQALSANSEGKSSDWDRDREAYCLTLVCAFGLRSHYFADRSDIQDLLIQYYDPQRSHFARLPAIQDRIIHSSGTSRYYMLGRLPLVNLTNTGNTLNQAQRDALTMLNLLYAVSSPTELLSRFMEGKNAKKLLEAELSVQVAQSTSEGTIPEILSQHALYSRGLKWLLGNYGHDIDATRLLMRRIGSDFGSGCTHKNTDDIIICIFAELLSLGADPNGPGFKATPLQVAAYRADFNAVKLLLVFKADPNVVGDRDGKDINDYQQVAIRGQPRLMTLAASCTPLQILKRCQWTRKARGVKIERILIANGAREKEEEVSSGFSQSESHATIPSSEGPTGDAGETDIYPMGEDRNNANVDVQGSRGTGKVKVDASLL